MEWSEIPTFVKLLMGIIAGIGFGLAFWCWFMGYIEDQKIKRVNRAFDNIQLQLNKQHEEDILNC